MKTEANGDLLNVDVKDRHGHPKKIREKVKKPKNRSKSQRTSYNYHLLTPSTSVLVYLSMVYCQLSIRHYLLVACNFLLENVPGNKRF